MDELRWIHVSVILTALLHFTASVNYHFFIIEQGEDVTLPCKNLIDRQQRCDGTEWYFVDSTDTRTVRLTECGQVSKNAGAQSDRLSVREDCSLVIKKVTQEDAGIYGCRQERLGPEGDTQSSLSVVIITEHIDNSYLSVICDVRARGGCRHTVKWIKDENNEHVQTPKPDSRCQAVAFIPKAHASREILLKCEITDESTGKVQHFPFSRQTTAVTPPPLYYNVRVGDDVSLSCLNVVKDQQNCDSTTWMFNRPGSTVELVRLGQKTENSGDRLSVREDCSLVIKKVRVEDVGLYYCRQFRSDRLAPDAPVHLSVISMTEYVDRDEVTVTCSVSSYQPCKHSVRWLYEGKDVREHYQGVRISEGQCYSSVTFKTSEPKPNSLDCEVTADNKVELFTLRLQPSAEEPGEDPKNDASTKTPTGPTDTSTVCESSILKARFMVVSVGLSALIITVVTVNIWTRTKGKRSQRNDKVEEEDDEDETVMYENIRASAED